jgi:hypothetical protein
MSILRFYVPLPFLFSVLLGPFSGLLASNSFFFAHFGPIGSSISYRATAHNAEIIVFLDVAGTARTSIDLIDLCDGDPACPGQPFLPYCLKTDWREQIAASIIEDILYDHRALPALKLLLLTHARFKLFRRRDNGVDDNCNRQSTFKLKMQETIDTGSCFCVAVRLYGHDMLANQLSFRSVMPVNTPPIDPVSPRGTNS